MKKTILSAVIIATAGLYAQVKVGSNPTNLATNALFQVEGTAAANQFIVLKNGNVGIGITAPTAKLAVTQSAGATTDLFASIINNCGAPCGQSSARNIVMANANATNSVFASLDFVPSTVSTGISGASIQGIDRDATNGYAGIRFLTRNATDFAARVTIKASGNVGIGTESPTAQFETTGSVKFSGAGTLGAGKVLTSDAAGNATWQTAAAAPVANIYNTDGALTAVRTVTMGTNALRFTGSGDLNLRGPKLSSWSNLILNANSDGTLIQDQDVIMKIRGTEYMRVRDAGRVGIGTNLPAARLDVVSSNLEPSLKLQNGSSANVIVSALSNGSAASVIETTADGNLIFRATAPGQIAIVSTPIFTGLTNANESLIACLDTSGNMYKRTAASLPTVKKSLQSLSYNTTIDYGRTTPYSMPNTVIVDARASINLPDASLFSGRKLNFYVYGANCDLAFFGISFNGSSFRANFNDAALRSAANQGALFTGTSYNSANDYVIQGSVNRFRTHTFISDGTYWWPDK